MTLTVNNHSMLTAVFQTRGTFPHMISTFSRDTLVAFFCVSLNVLRKEAVWKQTSAACAGGCDVSEARSLNRVGS